MRNKWLTILAFILLLSSCEEGDSYSEVPQIKLKSFKAEYEKTQLDTYVLYGKLSFTFVDGDGDIGFLENSDTISDNNQTDIYITEYYKTDTGYVKNVKPSYYLPYFEQTEYRKYLKGEILVKLLPTSKSDTAYFEFYIIDRSKNQSNLVKTPVYVYSDLAEQ